MCNLSEGIEERGIEKGIEKGIVKGKVELYYNEMHLSEKEISEKLGIKESEVKDIIASIAYSALSKTSKEKDNIDSKTITMDRLNSLRMFRNEPAAVCIRS